jgi:toxin ParE1/3/4
LGEARPLTVRYTRRAARQLDAILDFIEARSPQGAAHVLDRIADALALIAEPL